MAKLEKINRKWLNYRKSKFWGLKYNKLKVVSNLDMKIRHVLGVIG